MKPYLVCSALCTLFSVGTLAAQSELILPEKSLQDLDHLKFFEVESKREFEQPRLRTLADGGQPLGALNGATIILSAGHGWLVTNGKWGTQRSNSFGVVEDHSNAETVNQYLIPYLWNAGANVITTRERDLQTAELIETQPINLGPLPSERNPRAFRGKQFVLKAQTADEKTPTSYFYKPLFKKSGHYNITIWLAAPNEGKLPERLVVKIHTVAGTVKSEIFPTEQPGTWKSLGSFYFEAKRDNQAVEISNEGMVTGEALGISAVRFGGGMGTQDGGEGIPSSGKPRWEESGLYYAEFAGFSPDITGAGRRWNAVHAMPRFAEWLAQSSPKGTSVYLSWHTNASLDHTISGISTYIYGVDPWDSVENFSGVPGSERLAYYVHNRVLKDIRLGYNSEWEDVGIITRWLGETNPLSNGETPAMLLENGFHDNPRDAAFILDPKFRDLSARAAYRGLLEYFTNEVPGFTNSTLLPETPTAFSMIPGNGGISISWQAPESRNTEDPDSTKMLLGDAASGYRVFTSPNGYTFAGSSVTESTDYLITESSLDWVAVRVCAENEGGRSLPTGTLVASVPKSGKTTPPSVLIVNAFDRLDTGQYREEEGGGLRGIVQEMNSRDYPVLFAEALHELGHAFGSCSDEAFATINTQGVATVIWISGDEESHSADQEALAKLGEFASAGGRVLLSAKNSMILDGVVPGITPLPNVVGTEKSEWLEILRPHLGSALP